MLLLQVNPRITIQVARRSLSVKSESCWIFWRGFRPLMSRVKPLDVYPPGLAANCGEVVNPMIVQRWERSPETSVNNPLIRGFAHVRLFVWGCPGLRTGVDLAIGHKGRAGIPLAAAALPPLHEI
jgi:hypothetical protein